jgi:hypothetical protein
MTIIVRTFVLKVLRCVARGIFRRSAANVGPLDVQIPPASNGSHTALDYPSLPYDGTLLPRLPCETELGSSTVSRPC